ncbi:MAG: sugar transferase [Nitrospirae bacterium]|nr:sugar transferase [Nitrospirota bacterium]
MLSLKRLVDFCLSICLLVLLTPLFLLISVFVLVSLGRPILFRQRRVGLHNRPFIMLKFRTMAEKRDSIGNLLSDEKRINPFGDWLRQTSLDELPELINVLRGEMSLVGPRPLLMEYLPLYTSEQARRHAVLPGITGWAQVNGRNTISWEEKFIYDVWYVDHQSFWLDMKILLLTAWKVLKREGVNQLHHATTEAFKGTSTDRLL